MNPDNQLELIITLALLVVEVAIIAYCSYRLRQPVNPAKPRIFPYNGVIMFLALGVILTAAHTYSVYTGHRLEARNKMNRGGMGGAPQQPMR
jgi:hypothetical protein